jgi:cytochrome b561
VTIWTLTVFRLVWRVTGAQFPALPASMTPLHQLGARLSEYGLYALLLIQPATGVAQTILRGRPFEVFAWSIPPLVAKNVGLAGIFRAAHEIGAWCLFALAGLHAAAALVHHFILRDDVLEAMAPAFRRRGTPRTARWPRSSATQPAGRHRAELRVDDWHAHRTGAEHAAPGAAAVLMKHSSDSAPPGSARPFGLRRRSRKVPLR